MFDKEAQDLFVHLVFKLNSKSSRNTNAKRNLSPPARRLLWIRGRSGSRSMLGIGPFAICPLHNFLSDPGFRALLDLRNCSQGIRNSAPFLIKCRFDRKNELHRIVCARYPLRENCNSSMRDGREDHPVACK